MNSRKNVSCWLYRLKDIIYFWQIHNFCEERLRCDWSLYSSICKWSMVYSAGENSEQPFLQKTQTSTHFRRCQMLWPVWVQACHTHTKLHKTQRGNCHIMSPNNSSHSTTADEKARHKDSRRVLHRRKTNMHRGFQTSMFNTDHHKTTFSVLTQHSTVGWHTVPWLHIVLISCRTELRTHR